MENPEISGIEYQQGELQGYEIREYLLNKWDRKCAYCRAENIPLQWASITGKRIKTVRFQGNFDVRLDSSTVISVSRNHIKAIHRLDGYDYTFVEFCPYLSRKNDGVV